MKKEIYTESVAMTQIEKKHIRRTYIRFLININHNIDFAKKLYPSKKMKNKQEEIMEAIKQRLIIRSIIRNFR